MAVYVLMKKIEDNGEKVVYMFGPNETHMGVMDFNKLKKEFSTALRPMQTSKSDIALDGAWRESS